MIETNYGKKIAGNSPFIIVAPHAAGDDLKTGYIARKLAYQLNGFAVINTVYKKPSNTKATPETTEDFNQLTWWSAGKKYLWFRPVRHHTDMRQFFRDIREYAKIARTLRPDGKAICVHIHGMKSSEYAIDLGAGFSEEKGKNTGDVTLEEASLKALQKTLEEKINKNFSKKVSIGKFAGISKQSAIQFHTHGKNTDHGIQIEISSFFRKDKEKSDYIIGILAQTLSEIF